MNFPIVEYLPGLLVGWGVLLHRDVKKLVQINNGAVVAGWRVRKFKPIRLLCNNGL